MDKKTLKICLILLLIWLILNRLNVLLTGGVRLPSLSGYTEEEITAWSEEHDIPVEFIYDYVTTAPEGVCIFTNPSAGAAVTREDTVIVTINRKD